MDFKCKSFFVAELQDKEGNALHYYIVESNDGWGYMAQRGHMFDLINLGTVQTIEDARALCVADSFQFLTPLGGGNG